MAKTKLQNIDKLNAKGKVFHTLPERLSEAPFETKIFTMDFDKVKTLEDVILILKGINLCWRQNNPVLSEDWQVLIGKGILK